MMQTQLSKGSECWKAFNRVSRCLFLRIMKKFLAKIGIAACCMLFSMNTFADDNVPSTNEPIAFTVIMFEDGTTRIYHGELTNDEIIDIYEKYDNQNKETA